MRGKKGRDCTSSSRFHVVSFHFLLVFFSSSFFSFLFSFSIAFCFSFTKVRTRFYIAKKYFICILDRSKDFVTNKNSTLPNSHRRSFLMNSVFFIFQTVRINVVYSRSMFSNYFSFLLFHFCQILFNFYVRPYYRQKCFQFIELFEKKYHAD